MRVLSSLIILTAVCIISRSSVTAQTYMGECAIYGARNICMKSDSNFVFICGETSGLTSVDITDPYHPTIADILPINTGSIAHIFIRGNSAYLSGMSTNLNIADISNPHNMTLISNWDTNHEFVHCSYVIKNIAYLSTCYCLLVVDVTDEANPQLLHEIYHCGDGYGICADNNHLYMGDMTRGLVIFDITNNANPEIVSTTPIFQYMTYYSSVFNQYVYLPSPYRGVAVINASDPLAPNIVDTIGEIDRISSTFILNNLLFVVSVNHYENQPNGLFVYDLSEPANPALVGYYEGNFSGVWATDQYIYLVGGRLVILSFDASSTENEQIPIPNNSRLLVSYPNPFNAQTTISYSLPEPGPMTLTIYNLLGQKVATLFDGVQTAGEHKIIWDAKGMTSGVYFCRIENSKIDQTAQMILLR
jgi:hypothetical protein